MSEEDGDASFLDYLAHVASLSEEQLTAELDALYAARPQERERDPGWESPGVVALRDAIDAADGPAGDGERAPAPEVTIVEPGTLEGVRARLATDVTSGHPEPKAEPQIGSDGVWIESAGPIGEPWQWSPWRRFDQ